MTAPSNGKQLEDAKAALQKRFTQMLLSSKDKTDKIEKLLAKSPEFQNLLSASAADVMRQATAMGHSDDASTRFAATKVAETEAQKVMSKLRGSISAELKTRIAEDYGQIEALSKGLRDPTAKADGAFVTVASISDYEFMTNVASADYIKIKLDESEVRSLSGKMHAKHESLNKVRTKLDGLISSEDEAVLREGVRACEKDLQSFQASIAETTQAISKTLSKLKVSINEKALEALITQVVKAGELKDLEMAFKFVEKAIDVIGAAFKATEATETLNRAAKLISKIAETYGKSVVVDRGGKEHMKSHTDEEVRAEHTKDPLMLARTMYDKQQVALDIFLQGLGTTLSGALIAAHGAGEIVMKIWDPIADSITEVISSLLKERLKRAESALAAKDPAAASEAQTDEGKSLEGRISAAIQKGVEKLGDKLAEEAVKAVSGSGDSDGGANIFQEIAEDPTKLVSTVLKWVLKPVMKKVWEIFPPKPAEAVTGADLEAMLNQIHIAQLPIDMAVAGHAPRVAVDYTSLDERPDDIDQTAWAQFAGVNAGRTTAPNDPASRTYHVAVTVPDFGNVKVWGTFDPREKQFAPEELDPTAIDDWSGRAIAGAGYTDGPLTGEPRVKGTWSLVTVGSYRYVTLTEGGGKRHWGGFADNTRGPRGTASLLGNVVEALDATGAETMAGFPIGQ